MQYNLVKMEEYANFLEETSVQIVNLCNQMEGRLVVAVQCMDQQSGRVAAARLVENIENIKANVPVSNDAAKRLVKAKKLLNDAISIFGGK